MRSSPCRPPVRFYSRDGVFRPTPTAFPARRSACQGWSTQTCGCRPAAQPSTTQPRSLPSATRSRGRLSNRSSRSRPASSSPEPPPTPSAGPTIVITRARGPQQRPRAPSAAARGRAARLKNSFHNEPCAAGPRWTTRCGVLGCPHMPAYEGSLRPCLAPPIAPRRRSVIMKRVLNRQARLPHFQPAMNADVRTRATRTLRRKMKAYGRNLAAP